MIFVAFEETSKRMAANAESFGWNLEVPQRGKLFLLVVVAEGGGMAS